MFESVSYFFGGGGSCAAEGGAKKKKMVIDKNKYTKKDKKRIANAIKPITLKKAKDNYEKLRKTVKNKTLRKTDRVGVDFVDYFTFPERLNTVGNKGINFYDFYYNKKKYLNKTYVKKFLKYEKKLQINEEKKWYRIFNFYFSSINVFRPILAAELYKKYSAKCVLDPTMGWGGRLIAAAALDIDYIGIDLNTELKRPYENMIKTIQPHTKSKIQVFFEDALKMNYSKFKYDMVFTSPPYYNIEVYHNMTRYKTKEDWNTTFYRPLITETFKHLSRGGMYCLNVPAEIYDKNCVPILGEADEKLPLVKNSRNNGYKEFIYVWKKN